MLDGNGFNCTGKFTVTRYYIMIHHVIYFNADIDECESEEDNCHENANCANTEGSFTCSCNSGYTGDGVNCTSKLAKLCNLHT